MSMRPRWNGMCPAGKHGLDYETQECDLCAREAKPSRVLTKRPAEEIVLRALVHGIPVKLAGTTVHFAENGDLCVPTTRLTLGTGKAEEVFVEYPMTVGQFVRACREIPEEELFGIGASTALTQINARRAR